MVNLGGFEGIDEQARKNALHCQGDGQAIGRERIAWSESVFDLNRRVALQANLAGKMKCSAFPVQGILREAVERGECDEQRRKLWMIDDLEMERLLSGWRGAGDVQGQIHGNHRGRRTEFAGDGGEMVARDGANGAADVHNLCGSEIGRKCGDHAAARHGNLNVAEIQKRMAAEIKTNSLTSMYFSCSTVGSIPL